MLIDTCWACGQKLPQDALPEPERCNRCGELLPRDWQGTECPPDGAYITCNDRALAQIGVLLAIQGQDYGTVTYRDEDELKRC
jgi:hypothetical protein